MGLISIGGLGSGLDVGGIVDALVNAERAPKENSLNRLEAGVTVALTGLGGLSSALNELSSSALDLSLSSNYNKRSITQSSNEFFKTTATSDASAGDYNISIDTLARGSFDRSQVFTGGNSTTFGDGTLTFTVGGNSFDIDVSATDSLEDIRNKINESEQNDLVSVNLLNNITEGLDTGSVLTFDSSTLGSGNDLVVSYSGDASLADLSDNLTNVNAAGDASITIDSFTATSSSNTFTDVIQGVTITAKKIQETPGDKESLNVSLDTDTPKGLIQGFVEAFNAYTDVVKELGSAEEGAKGLLLGDYTLRQVSSQVKNLFSQTNSSVTGNFDNLTAIGITTTADGKLELDTERLDNALASDFDQFDELFTGEQGFSTKLRDLISEYTGSGGAITSRENSLNAQLSRIADDRISLSLRIEKLQFRLTNQFASMDAIVAQMNSTQSYIAQQFENLPGFGGKD